MEYIAMHSSIIFHSDWLFISLLFIIAFLYAAVGHGGASGYLALMAMFGFSTQIMKSSSLTLNLFVSLVSFYQYWKSGYFNFRLFLPFALASVPAAFVGSFITLDPIIFKKLVGVLLIFPILRMTGIFNLHATGPVRKPTYGICLIIGGLIGMLSGAIGIGGGIILSPIILLMKWGDIKQTAAVSALFIFVNSLSGMSGLIIHGVRFNPSIIWWIVTVLCGGFAGAYLASRQFKNKVVTQLLALVLVIASFKLISD